MKRSQIGLFLSVLLLLSLLLGASSCKNGENGQDMKGETTMTQDQTNELITEAPAPEWPQASDGALNVRTEQRIDMDWRFLQDDDQMAKNESFNDSDWRLLNLPHDWSIEGEYDEGNPSAGQCGFLPTGIGWYRKTIEIPEEWQGKQVSLVFDGVFCNSTVYVNGTKVGGREYGWLSFSCDITEAIAGKSAAVIAVKVDNSVQPAARWYTGSGIYSHVSVVVTNGIHIAENGTYVITPADENRIPTGEILLESTIVNDGTESKTVSVRSTVYRKSDKIQVAQGTVSGITVEAGRKATAEQSIKVDSHLLWDVDNPNLYEIETEILCDDTVVDDYVTVFGFRSVDYTENGLYLNGEQIKLKGVANHWALGAIGAAQPTNIIRYKIQVMKDMGVTCIRTAHNACPPEFYELCDEMGMLVLDELFEGEMGKVKGDYGTRWFTSHWREDVQYWIKRDRNHPSVIIWSIGNETGSHDDNSGISDYIKRFDKTRPTTGSLVYNGVDIPGANAISEVKPFNQPVSGKPVLSTEAPHTHGVRGVYRTQTWFRGIISPGASYGRYDIPHLTESEVFKYDWAEFTNINRIWPSSYDNAVSLISIRKHWTLTRDIDWRLGEFRWTGFDYLGEANYVVGGWPYRMFHSGAVDTALFEKDMYYLYQSIWTDEPMLHLLPTWTHPTVEEGTEIPVWVYSNCEKVELFLNGESLGMIDRGPIDEREWDKIQFDWLVPYKEGTIKAVAYDSEGNAILEESYTTASSPAKISLENSTGETFPTDPTYIGQVTVTTLDKDGNFYPYGENRAYYKVYGPAYVKAVDNGCPTDTDPHNATNRNAFMGLNKMFISPTGEEGDVLVVAGSILGEKRQLTSELVYIDVAQISMRGNPESKSFEIFYTLDGTTPTRRSNRYTEAFSVKLETTVKAAVYVEGEDTPIFVMTERFGKSEGMYWADADSGNDNVYPAANAEISGEAITKLDYGYADKYINFKNKPGYAEYTVNAESAGEYYVAVCYNNGRSDKGEMFFDIYVNGESIGSHSFRYNGEWDKFWSYRFIKVTLGEGENTIRFDAPTTAGPNLKELIVYPVSVVLEATDATLTGDDKIVVSDSALNGQAIDVGQGGTVKWNVNTENGGAYKLIFTYCSPNTSLWSVSAEVNGVTVASFAGGKVSNDYGSSWGFLEKTVTLSPGENVISLNIPKGGTYAGSLIVVQDIESDREAVIIEPSCLDGKLLAASGDTLILADKTDQSEESQWELVTNPQGIIYIINKNSGKMLYTDGFSVRLSETNQKGSAEWMRMSDMENFEYIVHVNTGMVLASDENGRLVVGERKDYNDADRNGNLAYWYIHK